MPSTRLDRWKKPIYVSTMYSGKNQRVLDQLIKQARARTSKGEKGRGPTIFDFIAACRELIFDMVDGKPLFHCVAYAFNVDRMSICVEPMFDILVGSAKSEEEVLDQIHSTLATASGLGIPVFPNTAALAPVLAQHHREMLINGFTAPDGAGKRVRLKLTKSPGARIDDPRYITDFGATDYLAPAEVELIRQSVSKEFGRLSVAEQALSSLRAAINQLSALLAASKRNEGLLQRCLTDNPSLFGPEYARVLPKHRLGAEFEMDYALERHSGLVDLVEIESSVLPLFTGRGDPTQHVTHAEQQVMDWLAWIEKHGSYARERLPGLMMPVGFVVMGSSKTLTPELAEKLRRRNALYRGTLTILTYEDLLTRAKNILRFLEGPSKAAS